MNVSHPLNNTTGIIYAPLAPTANAPRASQTISLHSRIQTLVAKSNDAHTAAVAQTALQQLTALDQQDAAAKAIYLQTLRASELQRTDCLNLLVNAYFNSAEQSILQKRYGAALANYTAVLEQDPKNSIALRNRAVCNQNLTNYDTALADYRAVLAQDPKNILVLSNRAVCYQESKNYTAALEDYTAVLEQDPKNILVLSNRAVCYQELKKYASALVDYTAVLEQDPKNTVALSNRAFCYSKLKKYDAAIIDYTAILEYDAKNSMALSNRAFCYQELNSYASALVDYTSVLEQDPKNTAALNNRAYYYQKLKNYVSVFVDYTAILEQNPKNIVALKARNASDRALSDQRLVINNLMKQADNLRDKKKYAEAIPKIIKALALTIGDQGGQKISLEIGLGNTYFQNNQFEQAAEVFSSIQKPESSEDFNLKQNYRRAVGFYYPLSLYLSGKPQAAQNLLEQQELAEGPEISFVKALLSAAIYRQLNVPQALTAQLEKVKELINELSIDAKVLQHCRYYIALLENGLSQAQTIAAEQAIPFEQLNETAPYTVIYHWISVESNRLKRELEQTVLATQQRLPLQAKLNREPLLATPPIDSLQLHTQPSQTQDRATASQNALLNKKRKRFIDENAD